MKRCNPRYKRQAYEEAMQDWIEKKKKEVNTVGLPNRNWTNMVKIPSVATLFFLALFSLITMTLLLLFSSTITHGQQQGKIHEIIIGQGSTPAVQQFTFTPSSIEIAKGDSVRWTVDQSAQIVDWHNVNFVRPETTFTSDIILPFVPMNNNQTDFKLAPPFNLGAPSIVGTQLGEKAIVGLNQYTWYPTILTEESGATLQAPYVYTTMNSSVTVLNSGTMLQKVTVEPGMENPPFPAVTSFTVTFQEEGDYAYSCAIHPWMYGTVTVK